MNVVVQEDSCKRTGWMVGGTFALVRNGTVVEVEVEVVVEENFVMPPRYDPRNDDKDDEDELEADRTHGAWRSYFRKLLLPHMDYELENWVCRLERPCWLVDLGHC